MLGKNTEAEELKQKYVILKKPNTNQKYKSEENPKEIQGDLSYLNFIGGIYVSRMAMKVVRDLNSSDLLYFFYMSFFKQKLINHHSNIQY